VTTTESSNHVLAAILEAGAKDKEPPITSDANEMIDPSEFKSFAEEAVPKSNGKVT